MDLNEWHVLWVLIHGLWMPSRAFNLDTKRPAVFLGPKEAQFGFSVQQHYASGKNWLLVGAPWEGSAGKRPGDVYRCPLGLGSEVTNSSCEKLGLEKEVSVPSVTEVKDNMNLGMNLAPGPDPGSFTVCAPLWAQECGSSYFAPGICGNVDSEFNVSKSYAPTLQKCGSYMDIVFVLDGSNSIYPWSEVQNFLVKTLQTFHIGPDQTQVGIVQYGEEAVHEFNLGEYRSAEEVVRAARRVEQLRGNETHTAKGIIMARSEAFSLQRGARPDAKKVMIVVTDGESHDKYLLPDTIEQCESDGITRYAIAVLRSYSSNADDVARLVNEVRSIASHPVEKHFFNVTSEATLIDIVGALGERIFSLEGTREKNESLFDLQMSQAGFSTHYVEGALVLGAVGAYEWMGTIVQRVGQKVSLPGKHAFESALPSELRSHAAYLGYSLTSARTKNGSVILVAGAPRFNHTGRTILFTQDRSANVRVLQTLSGEQIGSYFGGEVCAMDVDGDAVSDVLLVAAPMYMDSSSRETGRVSLYTFGPQGVLQWSTHLSPAENQDSRFGSALAAVPDLNQDGAGELVVGAPLEDERQGAVYLFHGHGRSLRTTPVQRIAASAFGPNRLQYFGRALHGALDMDKSGVADLAVGANGKAVLLWSRAIARVSVTVKFNPDKINLMDKTCKGMGQDAVCVTAQVCLGASVRPSPLASSPLELVYNVTLDPMRPVSRAHMFGGVEQSVQGAATVQLDAFPPFCRDYRFYVMELADIVKPLEMRVDLALKEPEEGPVLDADKPSSVNFQLPFTKDCGTDELCETDLVLTLDHDIKGTRESPYVVRPESKQHVVSITLENHGENAYNTKLNFTYSPNQEIRNIAVEDGDVKADCLPGADNSNTRLCQIVPSVFRPGAKVTIQIIFDFSRKVIMKEATFEVEVKSDSTETAQQLENNRGRMFVPLKYETDLILLRDSNVAQLEVDDKLQKLDVIKGFENIGPELKYTFKVQNLGFPVPEGMKLTISVPTMTTQNNHLLYVTNIRSSPPEIARCDGSHGIDPLNIAKRQYQLPATAVEDLSNVLTCANASCYVLTCTLGRLDEGKDVSVTITSRCWNSTFATAKFKSVQLVTHGKLQFDPSSFLLVPKGSEERTVSSEHATSARR